MRGRQILTTSLLDSIIWTSSSARIRDIHTSVCKFHLYHVLCLHNTILILAEVEYSTNLDSHRTSWHPRPQYFGELPARYKREHPQVSQVSQVSGAEPVGVVQ